MNIVPSLKILPKENYEAEKGNNNGSILNYINKFRNHPSIKLIKSIKRKANFNFSYVSHQEVLNKNKNLQSAKTTQQNDIPVKIVKETSEVLARYFMKTNLCIEYPISITYLKLADVNPAFKKKSKALKDNYRPISILPNISKVYGRCLYNQIQTFFDEISSKCQSGFHKRF